ncbi:MAG: YceI family protein [Kofleriaceae bacterium]
MLKLDASAVECRVFTFKEGALSALAHDLELRVTRLTLEVGDEGAAPRAVRATFDARSLVVLHALRDGKPTSELSDSDKSKIVETLQREVLDVRKHSEIVYQGRAEAAGDGFALTGELTLTGRRRAVPLRAAPQGRRMVAETTLHQPDFGIKPYRALLGALKVRPEVKVRISLPWPLPA